VIATLVGQTSSDVASDAASTGIGIGVLLVYLVVVFALLAFHIYVLVDILKYSDAVWQASGQNKTLWIVLWVVAFCCGGIIIDLIYWFAIRPKLQTGQSGPGAGGGYPNYPG
jgi:lysylphosphatidylglycerol synthetase-like protein (DUF2156 family)